MIRSTGSNMAKCQRCGEEKDISILKVCPEKKDVTCLMCHWDFKDKEMAREMENQAINTHHIFMESADKIWRKILE